MSFIDDYTDLDEQGNPGTARAIYELTGAAPQALAAPALGLDYRAVNQLLQQRALGLLQGSGNAIDPTTAGLLGMAKAFAAAGAPSNVPRSGLSALSAGLTGFAEPYAAAKQAGSDSAMKGLMMLQQLTKPITLAKGSTLLDPNTLKPMAGGGPGAVDYTPRGFVRDASGRKLPYYTAPGGGPGFVGKIGGGMEPYDPNRHFDLSSVSADEKTFIPEATLLKLKTDFRAVRNSLSGLDDFWLAVKDAPDGVADIKQYLTNKISKFAGTGLSEAGIAQEIREGRLDALIGKMNKSLTGGGPMRDTERAMIRSVFVGSGPISKQAVLARLTSLYKDQVETLNDHYSDIAAQEKLRRRAPPSNYDYSSSDIWKEARRISAGRTPQPNRTPAPNPAPGSGRTRNFDSMGNPI